MSNEEIKGKELGKISGGVDGILLKKLESNPSMAKTYILEYLKSTEPKDIDVDELVYIAKLGKIKPDFLVENLPKSLWSEIRKLFPSDDSDSPIGHAIQ